MRAIDEGVVLRHGSDFDREGARDVFVWRQEGVWHMHYDAAGQTGWLVALATSTDGRNWTKRGTVISLGDKGEPDSASASYGIPYFDGNTWHLFYLGTPNVWNPGRVPAFPYQTLKATGPSPTGPWKKQKSVLPIATKPGTYYSVTASPGSNILRIGDEHLQIFSVADMHPMGAKVTDGKIRRSLSIARTRDLNGTWTVQDEPILPMEEQVENSSLHFEPSIKTWFLFTNHIGITPDGEEYTDAIWVYWSKDVTRWNAADKAVVLDPNNCTWSKRVIGLPSVVADGGRLFIYYDGLATTEIDHCGRDIGLAWLPLPLQVPR
jgi:hypothetical protein